jgi:dTDP-4-dehydrorhamnose reductase
VTAACRVIDQLVDLEILPVFVSSDAVFDGGQSWYEEEAAALPILTYGKQKLEVERYLAAKSAPWLALRLPKLISEEADPRCMITSWVKCLAAGKDIRCATDQFFTPAAVADAASAIDSLLERAARGLFHLAGPDRMSRRQLLAVVLDEYRRHASMHSSIVDCSLKDFDFAEARPLDTSMCSKRAIPLLRSGFRGLEEVARTAVRACLARRPLAG